MQKVLSQFVGKVKKGGVGISMKVLLTKPIMAHDEEVIELELKEPSTKLTRRLGLPYRLDERGIPYPVADVAANFIVRLAGIPSSSVDELSPVDFNNLALIIISFFLSSAEAVEAEAEKMKQKAIQEKS